MKQHDPSDYSVYSREKNSWDWVSILHIHGTTLDRDLITERLGLKHNEGIAVDMGLKDPESLVKELGGTLEKLFQVRVNDPRMSSGSFWVHCLTPNQLLSTHNVLERHIELWLDLLYRHRSAFAEFQQLGYWTVLDCIALFNSNIGAGGPVQFRLPPALVAQLGRLGIDVDFTVADSRMFYRQELADGSVVF